ncbi:recombinase family protein [Vibrio parahaemolyticus]|uniref:recombinase family protein n=1 Tax=Vibrio alginolyticus TaxID=663 RepID=UPI0007AA186E|nr:recombinase family protein [Vibrio alginolyticus]MBE4296996.1 recombinase family protein [Vibrio parahaemolyticus]EHK9549085.1 recombinase family protein [Vibrio alginolyticus]EHK9605870.1 recombinase family protein [Vibrio alginolyticus]EKZ8663917.1 recombinase family protein [Vibrio alginolyticus]KZC45031.1 Resolvase-like:Recombinase protein [Vibrio alginolyticus]
MNKYHLYQRVSKQIQAEEGQGIQRQEQACEHWISDYNKRLLSEGKSAYSKGLIYEDRGKSAYTAANFKRGELGALINDIENGKIEKGDLIVIELIDRFSRANVDFVRSQFQRIIDAGVKIAITKWNLVFEENMESVSSVTGRILLEIGMYLAYQESSQKSSRIKASRKLLEDSGRKSIAKPPFWLARNSDLKSYTIIEENAEIIRKIFDLKLNFNYGPQKIIKSLGDLDIYRYSFDENGNLIKTTKNSPLSESSINAYIRNTNVIGKLDGKDYYPRIIDDRTFYAVQKRTRENTGGVGEIFRNVFVGVGKCGCLIRKENENGCGSLAKCGYIMAFSSRKVKNPTKGMYLKCNRKRKSTKCDSVNINYYLAQNKIYNVLKSLKFDIDQSVDISHLEEKINTIDKSMSKIREYMTQYSDDEEWENQYKIKRMEREKIENEIKASKSRITGKLSNLDIDFSKEKDRVLFNQFLKDNRITVYFTKERMEIIIGSLNNFSIKCGYDDSNRDIDHIIESYSKNGLVGIEEKSGKSEGKGLLRFNLPTVPGS